MTESLKNTQSEDLISRWNEIFPSYIKELEQLKTILFNIDKHRNELFLIRNELLSRNIKIDEPK